MGKSKKLAGDIREAENQRELLPLESPRPIPTETRTIKMKGITNELNDALVNYLQSRPYVEVAGLLASLSQSHILDVTIIDGK